jgi:hypothetical protein
MADLYPAERTGMLSLASCPDKAGKNLGKQAERRTSNMVR